MRTRMKIIVGAIALTGLGVITLLAAPGRLPSDEALRARFLAHRADFERLVAMTNEDSHLTRIAPDFTWLDEDAAWPRENVGISKQRWDDYRQEFRRVGASDGILNYANPTLILFPIVSGGLVPAGFEKGIVYSQAPLSPILKSLDENPPSDLWDGPDRTHVLAYKPIENHWYIFYEQW